MGGSLRDEVHGIAIDGDGNVVVVGQFRGTSMIAGQSLTSVDGNEDVFVASYTSLGEPRWAKRFGGPSNDGARAVVARGDGSIVIAGTFQNSISFGGKPLM